VSAGEITLGGFTGTDKKEPAAGASPAIDESLAAGLPVQ